MKNLYILVFLANLLVSTFSNAEVLSGQSTSTQVPLENKQFFKAVKKGDLNTVKQAVINNPSIVKETDSKGYTALHNASYRGHKKVVNYLLENGANANLAHAKHGSTPLHSAASKRCNSEVVKALLSKGADQTKADNYGKTPIEYATHCKKKNKSQ